MEHLGTIGSSSPTSESVLYRRPLGGQVHADLCDDLSPRYRHISAPMDMNSGLSSYTAL